MLNFQLNVFALSDAQSGRGTRANHNPSRWQWTCEWARKGQMCSGFAENMNLTWIFCCFAPHTHIQRWHSSGNATVITRAPNRPLPAFGIPSSAHPGFFKTFKNSIHIPPLVSLFFHLRLQPQLYLRYFGVDRRPFETEYPFTSHTFLINENDFSPHTHPTRPSHPLIYRRHGGLSWQRPSCDVFSPMCMALLSVKLCFTINKTGLSVLKYRKWIGERVNCD